MIMNLSIATFPLFYVDAGTQSEDIRYEDWIRYLVFNVEHKHDPLILTATQLSELEPVHLAEFRTLKMDDSLATRNHSLAWTKITQHSQYYDLIVIQYVELHNDIAKSITVVQHPEDIKYFSYSYDYKLQTLNTMKKRVAEEAMDYIREVIERKGKLFFDEGADMILDPNDMDLAE